MKRLLNTLFAAPGIQTVNPMWMVALRCGIAFITLVNFIAIQPDFDSIFSANGFIPPDIANAARDFMLPTIYGIYKIVNPILHMSYVAVLTFFRIIYPIALIILLLGFLTRGAAIASLLLQLLFVNSMNLYSYGADIFTGIALFYCCIFPVGRYFSVDKILGGKTVSGYWNARYLKLFKTHVCLIYIFSGFEKLLGENWRNGESIWRMVHGYNTTESINVDFLYNTPVFVIVGWLTITAELLYPIFINIPKTRNWWLAAIVTFHISIAFFMGLYFFSSVMIILNIAAYYMPYVKEDKPLPVPAATDELLLEPYYQP
jgi:hypothetical protein